MELGNSIFDLYRVLDTKLPSAILLVQMAFGLGPARDQTNAKTQSEHSLDCVFDFSKRFFINNSDFIYKPFSINQADL